MSASPLVRAFSSAASSPAGEQPQPDPVPVGETWMVAARPPFAAREHSRRAVSANDFFISLLLSTPGAPPHFVIANALLLKSKQAGYFVLRTLIV